MRPSSFRLHTSSFILLLLLTACVRPAPTVAPWYQTPSSGSGALVSGQPTQTGSLPTRLAPSLLPTVTDPPPSSPPTAVVPPTPYPVVIAQSPTPDTPHVMPALRTETETYIVQTGDALGKIAQRFQVSLNQLIEANPTINPDILYVGTALTVPPPNPGAVGPGFRSCPIRSSSTVPMPPNSMLPVSSASTAATCPPTASWWTTRK